MPKVALRFDTVCVHVDPPEPAVKPHQADVLVLPVLANKPARFCVTAYVLDTPLSAWKDVAEKAQVHGLYDTVMKTLVGLGAICESAAYAGDAVPV